VPVAVLAMGVMRRVYGSNLGPQLPGLMNDHVDGGVGNRALVRVAGVRAGAGRESEHQRKRRHGCQQPCRPRRMNAAHS
jgi:hypothetical protein